MKVIIAVIICMSVLVSSNEFFHSLETPVKAEIKIKKLIDGGYYEEARKALNIALQKYPDNATLYAYSGEVFYQTGDLKKAKFQFMLSLKKDPTNEIASGFVQLINEQIAAQTNEDLERALGYLSNKGFDFLLIFLAFLGGEVISKRYSQCSQLDVEYKVKAYLADLSGVRHKIHFIIKNLFQNFSIVCLFLFLLVISIISLAFALVLVWFQLLGYMPLLSFQSTETLTMPSIVSLAMLTFFSIFILFIAMKIYFKYKKLNIETVDIADQLQKMAVDFQYKELRKNIHILAKDQRKFYMVMNQIINNDARSIIEQIYSKLKEK